MNIRAVTVVYNNWTHGAMLLPPTVILTLVSQKLEEFEFVGYKNILLTCAGSDYVVPASFSYHSLVVSCPHMSPMCRRVVHVHREDIQLYKHLSELLWRQT